MKELVLKSSEKDQVAVAVYSLSLSIQEIKALMHSLILPSIPQSFKLISRSVR